MRDMKCVTKSQERDGGAIRSGQVSLFLVTFVSQSAQSGTWAVDGESVTVTMAT